MDRETLSHYGWIVILVLILMCLLFFATPFGSFVANGVKVTLDGYINTNNKVLEDKHMDSIVEEWENEFLDNTPEQTPPEKSPEDTPDVVLKDDDEGGIVGEGPINEGPETPEEIPLPEYIEFIGGKFESTTTAKPGSQVTTTYTEYVNNPPKPYAWHLWSRWLEIYDWIDGGVLQTQPYEMKLSLIDKYHAEYIVYDTSTTEAMLMNGVEGDSIKLWYIMIENNVTLEDVIYLAAYLQKIGEGQNLQIAQWNGSSYTAIDYETEINAITNFTKPVTRTKVLETIAPSASTNVTFVPIGAFKAEAGTTWREWLASDYNTSNVQNPVIRDINFNLIDLDSQIESGKQYGLYDVSASLLYKPGLYATGTNYGTLIKSWETMIKDGTLSVTDGLLKCNDKSITGDLIISNDENIIGIAAHGFEDCTKLTSVVIPGNIKTIYLYGFYGCSSLEYVELCEGIETLWEGVFRSCESLLGLTLPDSLTHFENGGGSLMFCQSFSYINLGSGLTIVPNLYGKFEELIIPDGYTDGGYHTIATFETVYVPTSVTQFGEKVSGFALQIFGGATIHYAGTEEQWNQIVNVNKISSNATIIFNSPYTGD